MKKIDIICCSTDDWDEIWRRRQHLCNGLSKKDWIGKILFVEPAFSMWSNLRRLRLNDSKNIEKIRKINDKIYVFKPIWPLPFVRFNMIRKLNFDIYLKQVKKQMRKLDLRNVITWFSHPSYESIAGKFGEKMIWYDCTDDWSKMPAITKHTARIFERQQDEIIRKANIVTVVSQDLLDKAKKINRNSYLIQNGVDFEFYSNAMNKNNSMPEDLKGVLRPILGYVGSIWADRLDFNLVKYIAEKKKNWSLVFIGPITVGSDLGNIRKFKNVHFLGKKSYQELPKYMTNFDICIIPHKKNELTESMNPIKLYEYFAIGKPIISTDIAGVRKYNDVIEIAQSYEEFVNFAENLLKNDSKDLKNKCLQYAQGNSWQRRVEERERILK